MQLSMFETIYYFVASIEYKKDNMKILNRV